MLRRLGRRGNDPNRIGQPTRDSRSSGTDPYHCGWRSSAVDHPRGLASGDRRGESPRLGSEAPGPAILRRALPAGTITQHRQHRGVNRQIDVAADMIMSNRLRGRPPTSTDA